MLRSKLHCPKCLNLILFSYKILNHGSGSQDRVQGCRCGMQEAHAESCGPGEKDIPPLQRGLWLVRDTSLLSGIKPSFSIHSIFSVTLTCMVLLQKTCRGRLRIKKGHCHRKCYSFKTDQPLCQAYTGLGKFKLAGQSTNIISEKPPPP